MKISKLLSLLATVFLLAGNVTFAKNVDEATARLIGYNFVSTKVNSSTLTGKDGLSLAYTSKDAYGNPCYYIYNLPNGFVIVSGDDAVKPVLAFSNEVPFQLNKVSPSAKYLLDGYNLQIANVKSAGLVAPPDVAQNWNVLQGLVAPHSADRTTSVVVAPLLGSLIWDQSPYYNDSCPNDVAGGGLSVTGCVATATAQVMKFWGWPAQGVGSHSYTSATLSFNLSANFGATTYNWASMPNSISAHNTAIAQLMFHVGVAVDMDYTAAESGAYVISSATGTPPNCAQYALTQYFKYDPTSIQGLSRSDYADAAWYSLIETDLNAGRPVIYSGSGTAGGHCWVLDGYDDTLGTNYFHCNWGWSGSGPDGYYSVDNMNPPALGTGGGGGGFDSFQAAIFGIKPDIFPITGTLTLCAGTNTTLSDATTGGTWTSGTTSVATITSAGVVTGVTGGTSHITYTVSGNSVYATVTVNPAPNAGTISPASLSLCLGQVATLTDGATGGTWSSSNTGVATVSGGVVTGVSGGSAMITYTSTNSCGTATASAGVTVNASPALTVAPVVTSPGTTPCVGTSASYSATCTGATSFVWTVSGTGWSGSSTTGSIITTVGSGTGTILVSGSNGCGAGPATTVNVSPDSMPSAPVLSMVGTMPCTGASSVTYNATSTGATTYSWTVIGSGWTGSSTTSSITLGVGTGTALVICATANGCGTTRADSAVVSSSPLPLPPTITLSGAAPCIGATSATYLASSSTATSYSWSVTGSGWSGSSTSATLNVTIGSGTGTIVCSGINACGTGTSTSLNVTPAATTGAASPIMATTSLCSGSTATFITSAISGATSYQWTVSGTGWSGSSTSTMINVMTGTGTGIISVAGVGPCGVGTPYVLSSIIPTTTPTASFSVASHTEPTAVNDLITYTGSAVSSGATYAWNFAGGTASPGIGAGPNMVSWGTPGLKTVTLSVTDDGCTSLAYFDTVLVEAPTSILSQQELDQIIIAPNPSHGTFDLLLSQPASHSVMVAIKDMEGRTVFNGTYDQGTDRITISLNNLPASVYAATIMVDGVITNQMITINR